MALTDTACKNAKPGDKPRKIADSGGLYLLVNGAGKYWRWNYRFAGKRKTMALGVYPDVPLVAARVAHAKARALLREAGVSNLRLPITLPPPRMRARVAR